jgi:hypothetical protein
MKKRGRRVLKMKPAREQQLPEAPPGQPGQPEKKPEKKPGPRLWPLPLQPVGGEYHHFRRLEFQEFAKPVRGFKDAIDRMEKDGTDTTAIAYIAVEILRLVETDKDDEFVEVVVRYLNGAIDLGG